jgi:hypothetical protein
MKLRGTRKAKIKSRIKRNLAKRDCFPLLNWYGFILFILIIF